MATARLIQHQDISEIENYALRDGLLVPVPADFYQQFTEDQLGYFCLKYGFYQLPTEELIDFLRAQITGPDGRRLPAIEIGAGHGAVARALGIPGTDSFLQLEPETQAFYAAIRQPVVTYGPDVIRMNAAEAVDFYKPEVVIGCFVTQRLREDLPPDSRSNKNGIDEDAIVKAGIK